MKSASELIHHDGSAVYVTPQTPTIGQRVELRLHVPVAVDQVYLRSPIDGEPSMAKAVRDGDWWTATLVMHASTMSYRWLVVGGEVGYRWITAAGHFVHEVADATDFRINCFQSVPEWALTSTAYQIFPDRFASSGREYEIPAWAVSRQWGTPPEGRSKNTGVEYFGGDLWGIIEKLDYLQDLGVGLIYTTPFFPAGSTHRYDSTTFDHVDPLLGGDEALIALVEAAHRRGMKVIGDITLNHTGIGHEWFQAALAGDPEKRGFYYFDDSQPYGYVTWLDAKSLPKLNFSSTALREQLITAPNSVLRKFLKAPFHLDGWRVDVANMMARLGDYDQNHEIARLTRGALEAEGTEKILIGEHNHNAGPDLNGDGWFGNMNYSGFQRPVWSWLADHTADVVWIAPDVKVPETSGFDFADTIKTVHGTLPWKSLNASWNLLGSHDTARIRTIVGSRARQEAAVFLMCTMPGIPMIFAEDEIGAQGKWGEDARTSFPWHDESVWDRQIRATYRDLIALRRSLPSLASGGFRFIDVGKDHVAYLRESTHETTLTIVARSAVAVELGLAFMGANDISHIAGATGKVRGTSLSVEFVDAGGSIWRLH